MTHHLCVRGALEDFCMKLHEDKYHVQCKQFSEQDDGKLSECEVTQVGEGVSSEKFLFYKKKALPFWLHSGIIDVHRGASSILYISMTNLLWLT